MYRQCPVAIVAAREDEALTHGQVLYGLVKPVKDMSQVESTAAMVNVIPKKRIYRMETPEEIDLFLKELMKRPLVLQPSAYIGRGLAAIGCALCTNEERWIIVINQSHPKINGRLQMGIDTARAKMARGEPFVIRLTFNEFLKRVYLDSLTRTALDARYTFIDFEDAEIVIRYPGHVRHRGTLLSPDQDVNFSFDDLLPSEITRRTVGAAQGEWQNPALRIVMPEELSDYLPGWQFEMIDPLEGVESDSEEEDELGAVGGAQSPPEEEQPQVPPTGRIMGRAQRKAKAVSQKQHVPVELHVPDPKGPQVLHRGNMPPSPASPSSRAYEDLNRDRHANEHAYERALVHSGTPSHKHLTADAPYEEMNVSRQQYSPNLGPSPQLPYTPRTPTAPAKSSHHSPSSPHSPHNPNMPHSTRTPNMSHAPHTPNMSHSTRTPNMLHAPHTPNMSHSTRTPNMSHSPHTPNMLHAPRSPNMGHAPHSPNMPHTPRTPNMQHSPRNTNLGPDRYNQDHINSPQLKSSKQTYLTDDDDGGFSAPSQRGHSVQQKYDTNFNKTAELDRYGNQYNPSDRYADPTSRPVAPPRRNFPPTNRPGVSPRGLHHQQGSGRSDTSASDSGFGESDESKHRNDKNSSYSNRPYTPPKTPYYNHAFQQESPEREKNVVDDIMAKHRAMAAQMLISGQPTSPNRGQTGYGKQEFDRDDNYGRELQKWRQNINDLEEACDVPQSDFSSTRLRLNSNRAEPVEESFI